MPLLITQRKVLDNFKKSFDYVVQWWLTDGQIDRLFARTDQLDDVIAWCILDVLAVNPPDLVTR